MSEKLEYLELYKEGTCKHNKNRNRDIDWIVLEVWNKNVFWEIFFILFGWQLLFDQFDKFVIRKENHVLKINTFYISDRYFFFYKLLMKVALIIRKYALYTEDINLESIGISRSELYSLPILLVLRYILRESTNCVSRWLRFLE